MIAASRVEEVAGLKAGLRSMSSLKGLGFFSRPTQHSAFGYVLIS